MVTTLPGSVPGAVDVRSMNVRNRSTPPTSSTSTARPGLRRRRSSSGNGAWSGRCARPPEIGTDVGVAEPPRARQAGDERGDEGAGGGEAEDRASSCTSAARGSASGYRATSATAIGCASATPTRPAMPNSASVSDHSCRARRPGDAPTAARIPNSRLRAWACARSRLAMFARRLPAGKDLPARLGSVRSCSAVGGVPAGQRGRPVSTRVGRPPSCAAAVNGSRPRSSRPRHR